MRHFYHLIGLVALLGTLGSCQSSAGPNDRSANPSLTNTARAKNFNERGVAFFEQGKFSEAERAFKQALAIDAGFGQAHNNLGRVYYEAGQLYQAAWEFQFAAKLLPNRPEPLNNIGLVYEAAGKWNDAVESYSKANALAPENPEYLGNLARATVRRGDKDQKLVDLLQEIVANDLRPEWVAWARTELVHLHSSATRPMPCAVMQPNSTSQ